MAAGALVVMVDRDEAAMKLLSDKHGDAVIPLRINLLDPKDCAVTLITSRKQAHRLLGM